MNPVINVFLGGTCGNNKWRDSFITALVAAGVPAETIFNPVVPEWNEEAAENERTAKKEALVNLFYIADPQDSINNSFSVYSLFEAVMELHDDPSRTIVVLDSTGMGDHLTKVMLNIKRDLVEKFNCYMRPRSVFDSISECADEIAFRVRNN